jgi:hypothetical protein
MAYFEDSDAEMYDSHIYYAGDDHWAGYLKTIKIQVND